MLLSVHNPKKGTTFTVDLPVEVARANTDTGACSVADQ